MEPGHRAWPPHSGAHTDQGQSQPGRPGPNYGPSTPQQHPSQLSPHGGSALPPPPPTAAPFPPFHQASHSLANLAGLSQSSPRQQPPSQARSDGPPHSQQGPGLPLPGFSQATGQPGAAERERERAREEAQIRIKEEQDRHHHEHERQRQELPPQHQTPQGPPVHLHQPVAVGPRTVHGPNGLLGNSGGQSQQGLPFGAPGGPGSIFAGGPVQPAAPGAQQMQPGIQVPYPGAPLQGGPQQQMGQGQAPGQQPILNDALSYLDQVKVQFADHPDVYNRFLDIMKDFKSGAIDTPGVIGRVSTLFAGNPDLIQGFNTFLPPGYRIECGAGDDPNAIRVTTPMGTTVQSMPQPRPLSRQDGEGKLRPANGTYTPQPGQATHILLSPSMRAAVPSSAQSHVASLEAARQQEHQAMMHQQEQRGVNQLQSAVSAAAGARAGLSPGPGRTTTPLPGGPDPNGMAGAAGQQDPVGMEKRGPVEFNHAISYVNKIKNRFSAHPDIYKQFLEILQTYQRESKPIQDVYSQVTHLFKTAPDLLEDFKQFLPESAAQAKAAAAARQQAEESVMLSNVRNEAPGPYGSPVVSREGAHIGTPNHGRGLPPVGNFAPTPITKDNNKRKRGERQGTVDTTQGVAVGTTAAKGAPFAPQSGKRTKQTHPTTGKQPTDQQPPASPTLVPALPSPIPPTTRTSAATNEELVFFDRAKKAIGNKNTMNEFLKLCNLFSNDLIDRSTLVHRARSFIGGNSDLLKWFSDFVGLDERDVVIENKARIPTGRISLSNCRGLGPSYRLLPKRERQRPCSGRDELCNSVLNDDWASHPTWASEDSGFIAHRKNTYEEALHRIEEERHDYDFNIETCSRTIQLLEPIAQTLRRMSDAEQRSYKLPPGLGGQSETIYKRVVMKLYGRDKGREVIDRLHELPYQVIPVLINRLKERLETWKMAQREWEKVWRDQTQKMFWKSLDHQAITARANDKRQFQVKTLQTEIQVRHEEMKRQNNTHPGSLSKPQMEFAYENVDVLVDAAYLVLVYVELNLSAEQPTLANFIKEFVPLFFGLDGDDFRHQMRARLGETPPTEPLDDSASGAEDSASSKSRKAKTSLLRSTLDRGRGKIGRTQREDSQASASRATTPDAASNADDDMQLDHAADGEVRAEPEVARWFKYPDGAAADHKVVKDLDPNEPQKREVYRMWANTHMYCFIRVFTYLYERLLALKKSEASAAEAIKNGLRKKPANDLGIADRSPTEMFTDLSPSANYYNQMVQKFEDVLKQVYDMSEVEEALRRYYMHVGYQLYGFEKMVSAISKFANSILTSETKDRSWDIYQLFKKDRRNEFTTAQQQTDYRKAAEKLIKEAEVYKIEYDQSKARAGVYLTRKDDPNYDSGLSPLDQENRWRYYIASYTSTETTDGIPLKEVDIPFLIRNVHAAGADPYSNAFPPPPFVTANAADNETLQQRIMDRITTEQSEERLEIRIAVNNYKIVFAPGLANPSTSAGLDEDAKYEVWIARMPERQGGEEGVKEAEECRDFDEDEAKERFVMINPAMRGLRKEDVEGRNEGFTKGVKDGFEVDGVDASGKEGGKVEDGEGMEAD
ncbi:hypothetical protein K431DRAFT_289187 [Polychaeton citri CBS 116435]|uniref:Histone deacetylase interacting domain-containing protein n=1 Tax=Polychaeton citri CBS 116435 TaxID=1314669 RepID=A0A9P4UID1_9PEZI|nr:hypothetical protein K431DRAFT_289187 [Polychaeton citri CBS 116435]